ncbi:Hypothetical protein NocV09_04900180, partial [Nannochloropsis oceanica]
MVPSSSLSTRPTTVQVEASHGDVDDEDVKRAPSVSLPSTEVAATREEEEEGEGEEQGGESDID